MFLSSLFKIIIAKKKKMSVDGKFKLNGLHRDHPPAWEWLKSGVNQHHVWSGLGHSKKLGNKISCTNSNSGTKFLHIF